MRILALTDESDRSESALLCGLAEYGHEITLLGQPADSFCPALRKAGVRLIEHRCHGRLAPSTATAIRQLTAQTDFDIVHAFTNRMLSNASIAMIGRAGRLVGYRGTSGHLSRIDPSSWLTYFSPRLDAISCVSDAVRQYLLQKRIAPSKLFTIHKGHRIEWYDQTPSTRLPTLPEGAVAVTCTANMRPVKGVDVLIAAMQWLQDVPSIHLILIGECRDATVQKRIDESPSRSRIHMTGYRKDAASLAGGSDLFVMPSRAREGLPKAVIEAMAQGVCPIVTAVGGMPELVRDGVDGLVVPPSDPQALAMAIRSLAGNLDLRSRMAHSARKRIQTDFSIDRTVQETLAMYGTII